ncbi:uncharacterized protein LOC126886976 [Diabrotica virgifera virgifera]|uniref:Uncharacterized protein n=1 Tax=Diabrotica virgifera virgifera TaxID=50390 RepID=A0ABM5KIV9_DIAVI|nr:uncharacterized protein LOC126886976 [Diabrotica virgifera virgifera]
MIILTPLLICIFLSRVKSENFVNAQLKRVRYSVSTSAKTNVTVNSVYYDEKMTNFREKNKNNSFTVWYKGNACPLCKRLHWLKNNRTKYVDEVSVTRNLLENRVVLPSGSKCAYSAEVCFDKNDDLLYLWSYEKPNIGNSLQVLYRGEVEQWTISQNPLISFISFNDTKRQFALQLVKKFTIETTVVWTTEFKDIFIHKATEDLQDTIDEQALSSLQPQSLLRNNSCNVQMTETFVNRTYLIDLIIFIVVLNFLFSIITNLFILVRIGPLNGRDYLRCFSNDLTYQKLILFQSDQSRSGTNQEEGPTEANYVVSENEFYNNCKTE